jgi:bifunctional non-homologous end joining protein LigD
MARGREVREGIGVLPELIRPMLATSGELPAPSDEPAWGYEMKWDGVRAVVYAEPDHVRVLTRNDREVGRTYPELLRASQVLGGVPAVLDGEVVALDSAGRPDFGLLQQRMHVIEPAQVRTLLERVPLAYLVFDLLHLDGRDLLDLPYDARRSLLEQLELEGEGFAVPPAFAGDATAALATSLERGLEGVVAKRRDSRYEPGRRSRQWVKVKHLRTQEVVIGGWRPGAGRREGTIGSLLLGVPDQAGLTYAGHVGTGFTDAMLADLDAMLRPLRRSASPFAEDIPRLHSRDAVWVEPQIVGEVAFGEWTRDGRLRHPVWRGLRPDKSPADVVRES